MHAAEWVQGTSSYVTSSLVTRATDRCALCKPNQAQQAQATAIVPLTPAPPSLRQPLRLLPLCLLLLPPPPLLSPSPHQRPAFVASFPTYPSVTPDIASAAPTWQGQEGARAGRKCMEEHTSRPPPPCTTPYLQLFLLSPPFSSAASPLPPPFFPGHSCAGPCGSLAEHKQV